MVSRPAAVPRAREVSADSQVSPRAEVSPAAAPTPVAKPGAAPAPAPQEAKADDSSLDFSGFEFSEFNTGFHVEEEVDPVDAEAEEAVAVPLRDAVGLPAVADSVGAHVALVLEVGDDAGGLLARPALVHEELHR